MDSSIGFGNLFTRGFSENATLSPGSFDSLQRLNTLLIGHSELYVRNECVCDRHFIHCRTQWFPFILRIYQFEFFEGMLSSQRRNLWLPRSSYCFCFVLVFKKMKENDALYIKFSNKVWGQ